MNGFSPVCEYVWIYKCHSFVRNEHRKHAASASKDLDRRLGSKTRRAEPQSTASQLTLSELGRLNFFPQNGQSYFDSFPPDGPVSRSPSLARRMASVAAPAEAGGVPAKTCCWWAPSRCQTGGGGGGGIICMRC